MMKARFFLLLLVTFMGFTVNAQEEIEVTVHEGNPAGLRDGIYMLDSAALYRRAYDFAMDRKDCYLKIRNDYAKLYYALRGKSRFLAGEISNRQTITIEGKEVNAFTLITDNSYAGVTSGKRYFFGISYDGDKPTVYELDVYRLPVKIFSAHMGVEKQDKKN